MADFLKNINWETWAAIVAIVVAVLTGLTYTIVKIFKLGGIAQRLKNVEQDVKDTKGEVVEARKDLTKRIDDLMLVIAQSGLTEAHSPRQLTTEGSRILTSSGVDSIVDSRLEQIVDEVRARNPENAYQAEQAILEVVEQLGKDPAIKDAVEEGAFNSGSVVSVVLFVAGIYVRDRVLAALDLQPEQIDQHKPETN